MTDRDEILNMARGCGIKLPDGPFPERGSFALPDLLRFAVLVEAAEREACAKVCEAEQIIDDERGYYGGLMAAAIRARSKT